MIETLHIENIGIIDKITVDLKKGLNIITGETGAGKSLLVDALSLICGNRFSKEIIKTGEDYCLVEIMLANDINRGEDIIVSREVTVLGKNKCKINGRLVTVNELKEYMSKRINIHGQNDNQNLLDEENHIHYLDQYCNKQISSTKDEYIKLYSEYVSLKFELNSNYGDEKERKRTIDLLEYEINEIDEANLKIGEDEEVESKLKRLRNVEKIFENISISEDNISSNLLNQFDDIIKRLSKVEDFDDKYKIERQRVENIYYELEDVSRNLYSYKENLSFDEAETSDLTKRLDLIYFLKRKYGNSIEEILKYREDIVNKKEQINNMEEYLKDITLKLDMIKKDMLSLAKKINEIRKENALELEKRINKELQDLEMKNAKIKIDICFDDNMQFNTNGLDKVNFKILTNLGDEFKTLNKIASGGEISRIMLAIKKVLSQTDRVPVLIFDEVDNGISGKAASVVGSKLKSISQDHQVLCITHLGVVAAYADNNYYISKNIKNNHTVSSIKLLDEKETINEIARISSGSISNVAIDNARELRRVACIV